MKNMPFCTNTCNIPISVYKSHSVSDEKTLETIKKYKNKYDYISDPHTATGLYVLDRIQNNNSVVSLACAHPAKFADIIEPVINKTVEIPSDLQNVIDKEKNSTLLKIHFFFLNRIILRYYFPRLDQDVLNLNF